VPLIGLAMDLTLYVRTEADATSAVAGACVRGGHPISDWVVGSATGRTIMFPQRVVNRPHDVLCV
jgi:hypothetical protein